jgi:predicted nucleic acid-binding protein
MPEQKKRQESVLTAFWDTSAIVPLCCYQTSSSKARQIARTYGRQIVWWATPVEAISALQRLVREKHITQQESAQSYARLVYLRNRWNEIQPTDQLRAKAEQLLRMHKLRAADSLQLSAALLWCNNHPREHVFIAGDEALSNAAQIEGFTILSL